MTVAWLVEILGDGSHEARGLYDFAELPALGDRVTLPKGDGKRDVMGVVMVDHLPVAVPQAEEATARRAPSATVFVHWIGEDDGSQRLFN